jgi:hypothetical protein
MGGRVESVGEEDELMILLCMLRRSLLFPFHPGSFLSLRSLLLCYLFAQFYLLSPFVYSFLIESTLYIVPFISAYSVQTRQPNHLSSLSQLHHSCIQE